MRQRPGRMGWNMAGGGGRRTITERDREIARRYFRHGDRTQALRALVAGGLAIEVAVRAYDEVRNRAL